MSKLRSQLNSLNSGTASAGGENREIYSENRLVDAPRDSQMVAESLPLQTNMRPRQDQTELARSQNQQELAEIKLTLQNLAHQLSDQANHNAASPAQPIAGNASGIDSDKIANALNESLRENLHEQMEIEIDKMRDELGALQQNANAVNNQVVLEDIQRISEGIHELQSRQVVSPDQFGDLAGEMRGLHQDIRSLSEHSQPQMDQQKITAAIQHNYDEIAQKLDGLGTSPQAGQLEALSEKLEHIKGSLPTSDPQLLSRIEAQLHELGSGISALTEISSNSQENAIDALLPEYFEGLDRRMDEITRAVMASAPVGNIGADEAAFDRIEARITSLAKSIENMSPDADSENISGGGNLSELLNMPEQMQSTLANLEHQIAQISSTGNSGHGIDEEFGSQLASLTQKIDQLQLASSDNIAGVPGDSGKASDIGGKLDELATTLELAINSGDGSVVQLEDRITELSNRIDLAVSADHSEQQKRTQNDTRIFDELQALAARVELLDAPNTDTNSHSAQFSALEEQISLIAAQLQSVGGQPDFTSIETRLGGIEEQFVANREAAQQAMLTNEGEGNTTAISELAEDLKNLTVSSSELKGHSLETFDAVRDSLAMILDRVNSIEIRIAKEELAPNNLPPVQHAHDKGHSAEMVDAARDYASNLAQQNSAPDNHEASVDYANGNNTLPDHLNALDDAEPGHLPQVNAPSMDLQHVPPMMDLPGAETALAGNDMPLEPGSGAPDLVDSLPETDGPNMDALMQQARENKRKDTLEGEQENPTDFIAAARRAAQAAAQDETLNSPSVDTVSKPKSAGGIFSRIGKRAVAIGAAVLLVGAVAIPAVNYLKAPQSVQISQTDIEQADTASPTPDMNKDDAVMTDMASETPQSRNMQSPADAPSDMTVAKEMPQVAIPAADPQQQPEVIDVVAATVEDTEIPASSTEPAATPSRALTQAPLPPKEVGPIVLRQAAASGDAKAQFEVGRRYTNGINGTPDLAKAVIWYKRAAASNFAPAQYRLGNVYEKGHGVTSNVDDAASWYKKAAEQGNALAMHNLAVINAMGVLTGGANMQEAATWFKMAAKHGVKDSQVNLGIVYAKAMGVDVDLAQAYKWFAIAAKAGDKDAAQKRDTVAKQMRPDQLELARGEVELWQPNKLDPEANTVNIPAEWNVVADVTASLSDAQMVQKTQSELSVLGFNPGPADGLMGAKTVRAIKDFQTRAGIAVNGKVTPDLIKALENAKNK